MGACNAARRAAKVASSEGGVGGGRDDMRARLINSRREQTTQTSRTTRVLWQPENHHIVRVQR